jgi:hypothetical protein
MIGKKFGIFMFQIVRVSDKYKEIVRIRVNTASWMAFPDGSMMGVWSSYVWKEFRICKWSISVRW